MPILLAWNSWRPGQCPGPISAQWRSFTLEAKDENVSEAKGNIQKAEEAIAKVASAMVMQLILVMIIHADIKIFMVIIIFILLETSARLLRSWRSPSVSTMMASRLLWFLLMMKVNMKTWNMYLKFKAT